ncbi:MAG: ubiquinone/menaquinone biosynthesis methyltransferase [Deltaproteobacteria bacterium]|nr:ubiquinone/menaquinone biosynthesis methyltransferase [Deltaproteobacteria bacterium]
MKRNETGNYPSVSQLDGQSHARVVRDIFSTISGRYDFLNRLLSLRRDVAWRRFTAQKMRFFKTFRLLDVAAGTADLAIETALRHPEISVAAVDFAEAMLEAARRKVNRRGLADRIKIIPGNALNLPFDDNHFDVTAIAFGIRNIPSRSEALKEMLRVTVPGGTVMVLEMNFPKNRFFRKSYLFYLKRCLPLIARQFSQNPAAYGYLADSIIHFPSPRRFTALMEETGFTHIEAISLTLGITYLYIGQKPLQE